MKNAVCRRCGEWKYRPLHVCANCGLDPSTAPRLEAESVYLSTGRFDTPEEIDAYRRDLDAFSKRIRSGETIDFPNEEIERLLEQRQAVTSVSSLRGYYVLFRFFLPVLLLLAAMYVVYVVLGFWK